ncbi:MAG: hypothetical protein PHI27_06310 [Eubacteriales bacterium]|nr:hypothetical protein [Eubacteriales bacterium]MDD3881847.1 hypothetical protein [Eubacteriales bacterium]MDD4512907.1 hypothetical protein [Eubacteriales bacterium]
MRKRAVIKRCLRHVCRECLSRAVGITLLRGDCVYFDYREFCTRCGRDRHIVRALRLSGRLKAAFAIGKPARAFFR